MSANLFAFGIGIGTQNSNDQWLEVFYAKPITAPNDAIASIVDFDGNQTKTLGKSEWLDLAEKLQAAGETEQAAIAKTAADSKRPAVLVALSTDADPQTVPEVYLKLHLLSHRLAKPHGVNLNGAFGVLPNVAWTNQGAIDLAELPAAQLAARANNETLNVESVDKFPKMTDYVVPSGVRVADTARVRLGAYLGSGTTIMHEGFVNFNAGTEGPGMIEGRISAGVFVGKGSDLGGGCSTMGTLSGGNNIVISVGESCLIGANAGLGIPLGDRCTIEAGLYVTAASKVSLVDAKNETIAVVKAAELANKPDLLFRRNSQSGAIECLTNNAAIALNEALHAND